MPTSTFTGYDEGTDEIRGVFSWTPTINDIGDYTLIFSVNDSTCDVDLPIVLSTATSFVVRVTEGISAGPDVTSCRFNDRGYQLRVDGTEYDLGVYWTALDGSAEATIDDPTSKAPIVNGRGNLAFMVETKDLVGTCKVRDTVLMRPDDIAGVRVFPEAQTVLCLPDYLQLDARFSGALPVENLECGTRNPRIGKMDSVIIFGSFAYKEEVTYDTVGATSIAFSNEVRTQHMQFLYRKEELSRYKLVASTLHGLSIHIADAQEDAHEYHNFKVFMKCTDKNSLALADGFESDMELVFESTTPMVFPEGWVEFELNNPYSWDSTKNLIIEFCYSGNPSILPCYSPLLTYVPASYVSGLILEPLSAAETNVCAVNSHNDTREINTRPLVLFRHTEAPTANLTFKWHPGNLVSDATIQQPLAYVTGTTEFVVETHGRDGCSLFDTLRVYVPDYPYTVTPLDTPICFGERPQMQVHGGFEYKWYEYRDGQYHKPTSLSNPYIANPVAFPEQTTTYRIVVYDSVWCMDTLETTLTVMPRPDIRILNADTVFKYGQSIQLLAAGARSYNWIPAATVSAPFSSNPLATPKESTEYVVAGFASNGCRAFDTVKVGIDYRENLMVPTAFSPNGDGRNDRFRIANLSFQKITEFRIFNRWGQEIFNGGAEGWDGSWKGVAQPIGNYQYLIKVAYPDGFVETFQGEVTLVR